MRTRQSSAAALRPLRDQASSCRRLVSNKNRNIDVLYCLRIIYHKRLLYVYFYFVEYIVAIRVFDLIFLLKYLARFVDENGLSSYFAYKLILCLFSDICLLRQFYFFS